MPIGRAGAFETQKMHIRALRADKHDRPLRGQTGINFRGPTRPAESRPQGPRDARPPPSASGELVQRDRPAARHRDAGLAQPRLSRSALPPVAFSQQTETAAAVAMMTGKTGNDGIDSHAPRRD